MKVLSTNENNKDNIYKKIYTFFINILKPTPPKKKVLTKTPEEKEFEDSLWKIPLKD